MMAAAIACVASVANAARPVTENLGRRAGERPIPLGLQLYTLGDEWVKDTPGTFAALAAAGVQELELPGLWGQAPKLLRDHADAAGLSFRSIHVSAGPMPGVGGLSLASSPCEIADTLGPLGITDVVLPLPPLPSDFAFVPDKMGPAELAAALARAGVDGWKRLAALLNEKAHALAAHRITLGYHNHNVEFAPVEGTTGWDILVSETEADLVPFELDLGWVSAAGIDPADMLRRMSGRVRWLHVKDLKASTRPNTALQMDPAEVGSGKTDWQRVLSAARVAGVRHYFIEQEPPFSIPRMEAVRRSAAFLARTI